MQYTDNYQFNLPTIGVDMADIRTENANWNKADAIMHASQVSLADAYDRTKTYNTDDVVMYEFLMYKCLEDEVTGNWDATKWQRTTAGEHGGGGGGSDVEANPQGTPTDTLETIGIGGVNYDIAGGNVYGAFINTNRVIQALTQVPANSSVTYTAIEDCILIANLSRSSNVDSYVSIGGTYVLRNRADGNDFSSISGSIYLKKGDIATIKGGNDNSTSYTIYGLTFGTNNIFTPQIYSTEERCVGVWIDAKPLYQKTLELKGSTYTGNININTNVSNIDNGFVVDGWGINNSGAKITIPYAHPTTDYLVGAFLSSDGSSVGVRIAQDSSLTYICVTILYTKATDTPGSGSWASNGVPAHHYSTEEQVVGTWIDGSAVYEKSFSGLSISIPYNIWVDSGCSIPGINKVIDIKAYANTASISAIGDPASDGVIRLMGMRNAAVTLEQFTIRYTKSTT